MTCSDVDEDDVRHNERPVIEPGEIVVAACGSFRVVQVCALRSGWLHVALCRMPEAGPPDRHDTGPE